MNRARKPLLHLLRNHHKRAFNPALYDPVTQLPASPSVSYGYSTFRQLSGIIDAPLSVTALHAPTINSTTTPHRSFASLGIVDKLSDDVAITLPPTSSRFWEVVEFRPDSVVETWKSPDSLGLHPRDVHLFAGQGMAQRAMIAPRGDAILVKTEFVKAIVYADKAVLFPSRRQADTIRTAQAIKSSIGQKSALPFEFKVLESLLSETFRAFEVRVKRLGMVAETVLDDINKNFQASVADLHRLIPITRKLTEVQNDIKETIDAISDVLDDDNQLQAMCLTTRRRAIGNLLPSHPTVVTAAPLPSNNSSTKKDKRTTSTNHDGGTSGSFEDYSTHLYTTAIPGSTTSSREGYTPQHSSRDQNRGSNNNNGSVSVPAATKKGDANVAPAQRSVAALMASRILESYEHKLMSAHGTLKEQLDSIEQAQSVWHMQLDHQRNRVLRLNLMISIMSLSGLIVTIPACFFGMNLISGLETVEGAFIPVVQCSLLTGLFTAGCVYSYFLYGPKVRYNARLRDMRSLRDLLFFHMDDMEEVIEALKRAKGVVGKKEFERIVRLSIKERPMSSDEISLLFRVFDQNKDAVVEMSELVKMEDQFENIEMAEKFDMSHHVT